MKVRGSAAVVAIVWILSAAGSAPSSQTRQPTSKTDERFRAEWTEVKQRYPHVAEAYKIMEAAAIANINCTKARWPRTTLVCSKLVATGSPLTGLMCGNDPPPPTTCANAVVQCFGSGPKAGEGADWGDRCIDAYGQCRSRARTPLKR